MKHSLDHRALYFCEPSKLHSIPIILILRLSNISTQSENSILRPNHSPKIHQFPRLLHNSPLAGISDSALNSRELRIEKGRKPWLLRSDSGLLQSLNSNNLRKCYGESGFLWFWATEVAKFRNLLATFETLVSSATELGPPEFALQDTPSSQRTPMVPPFPLHLQACCSVVVLDVAQSHSSAPSLAPCHQTARHTHLSH